MSEIAKYENGSTVFAGDNVIDKNKIDKYPIVSNFGSLLTQIGDGEIVDAFFSDEHFPSLEKEDAEFYAECPSGRMLDYIRTVVLGVSRCREEIDALIQRYSSASWDVSRISEKQESGTFPAYFREVGNYPKKITETCFQGGHFVI